ncbi:MAG: SGNH/GDSL hydrolase family protein [Rickettsiales bacterium]|jgi:lysophospholipase L1-like esterase|nr:SGNH/GDSL hydrolase family protein [Rickettsiales bacterium]
MKNILCFGDSNTYGYDADSCARYPIDIRWTGRLQKLLGVDYHIIEEGCNGRTTLLTDTAFPYKNTRQYIDACLKSHAPLDLMIICLGSNDLKPKFNVRPIDIAEMLQELIRIIRSFDYETFGKSPEILIMSPVKFANIKNLAYDMDETSVEKSCQLPRYYEELSKKVNSYYFDANTVVKNVSDVDGVHLTKDGHEKLADGLYKYIIKNISSCRV